MKKKNVKEYTAPVIDVLQRGFRTPKLFKHLKKAPGTAPGTLQHTGAAPKETKIRVIDYTKTKIIEEEPASVERCFKYRRTKTVTWINIDGVTPEIISTLGEEYGLHPLLMEDVLDVDQRPKVEEYSDHIFIVVKMLGYRDGELGIEQVAIVVGKNFVLTFQERPGDVFDPVRERLRKGEKRRIRELGPDYLAYALVDTIVDTYYLVLEELGEELEKTEENLLEKPSDETLHTIQKIKRHLLYLRKGVWPLREVLNQVYRTENRLVGKETKLFFRDVYDHTIQVVDTIETFRDMAGGLYDTYLSSVNNRMSEVMKVLTIIATIFIPLTFIAGIYGMNFNPAAGPMNMPELSWQYGYIAVWVVMIVVTLGMVVYFKRKGWL